MREFLWSALAVWICGALGWIGSCLPWVYLIRLAMCELLLGVSRLRHSQLLERGCKIKLLSWPAWNETKNTGIPLT
jgi:hypothetical protein